MAEGEWVRGGERSGSSVCVGDGVGGGRTKY